MRKYLVEMYSTLQINTKNKCRVLTGLRKNGIQGEEGAVFVICSRTMTWSIPISVTESRPSCYLDGSGNDTSSTCSSTMFSLNQALLAHFGQKSVCCCVCLNLCPC